jgi:magnesium transporter
MAKTIRKSTLAHVRFDLKNRKVADLKKLFGDLHPADVAELLEELDHQQAQRAYFMLEAEAAPEVLLHLNDLRLQKKLLASLTDAEVAGDIIARISSDDADDLLRRLPDERRQAVIALITDEAKRNDVLELLQYPEGSAGALMVTELVRVNVGGSMRDCVRELRTQAENIHNIYRIYVVDDANVLVGWLRLSDVLSHTLRERIRDVMDPQVFSVQPLTDAEEVSTIMERYDLVVIPVVDDLGRLKGRITIDDIVDVIRQEESEDLQKMGGMEVLDLPYVQTGIFSMVRKRATWLVILFVGEMFTATAMGFFEGEIQKAVILALFVPLIISSGGNSGSQATTLIIRAMALRELTLVDWWYVMRKEVLSGLLLGGILGVIGFSRIALWQEAGFYDYGPYWLSVGFTVAFSLVFIVLWGTLSGSMIPFILKRLRLDPATSSAPFVATLVDVTGLVIYFTIAALFLKGKLL